MLRTPLTTACTEPVVAPTGTAVIILVLFHVVGLAETPLNVKALAPCVFPKLDPLITTEIPTGPDVGEIDAIEGAPSEAFTVVVEPAETRFPVFAKTAYPLALT